MQVDFYILEATAEREWLRTACRLAEKAWQKGHRVFIHTDSQNTAMSIDDMLWTYRQDSFVPHALYGDRLTAAPESLEPVLVGDGSVEPTDVDVLINLSASIPSFVDKSARVAEIVAGNEAARSAGRERYRTYRSRGFPIQQHDI